MKTKGEAFRNFYLQNGYGSFSVSPYNMERLISYIAIQHEHHRRKNFEKEYLRILKKIT